MNSISHHSSVELFAKRELCARQLEIIFDKSGKYETVWRRKLELKASICNRIAGSVSKYVLFLNGL